MLLLVEVQNMLSIKSWPKTKEPASYQEIYNHVEHFGSECSQFIDIIEIDYYQGTTSTEIALSKDRITHRALSVITIQTWSRRLNQLRTIACSKDFCSAESTREFLNGERLIDSEIIALIERINSKIRQQFKVEIPVLIERLNDCMEMMKQYFLSFYQIESIQRIIENDQEEKLHAEDVPLSTLSRECLSYPFVFVLPRCYHRAREILNIFQTWLREDMIYTEFIERSLKSLDKKYREAKQAWELSKSQYSQIKYRTETRDTRLKKLEQTQLETDFFSKQQDYSSKCFKRQIYAMRLYELSHRLKNAHGNHTTIGKFQTGFKDLSKELPELESKIADDLCKTFSIVSKTIGRDWDRLYRELLFHPKRGQEELSNDLKIISRKYERGNTFQDQTMDALNKW
ncbi:unnamed protein product [Adineta ricciae]|uniref:Uncharacterized protein n=1 Tax=Adineta ricciae TaxID=249248 RepID=A0A814L3H0_ADIRI|nr:unnamed protein product [Adineta ricciae]